MTAPRVSPIGKAVVLEAFAKLLAPRPKVFVFRALRGWQYAATEMPETHQVLLGVSEELWHHINDSVYCATMGRVADRVAVQYVHEGASVVIAARSQSRACVVGEEPTAFMSDIAEIVLRPMPLGGA